MIAFLEFLVAQKRQIGDFNREMLKVSAWEELQPGWKGQQDDRFWWRRVQCAEYYRHLFELQQNRE